jgi:hypothetical protein
VRGVNGREGVRSGHSIRRMGFESMKSSISASPKSRPRSFLGRRAFLATVTDLSCRGFGHDPGVSAAAAGQTARWGEVEATRPIVLSKQTTQHKVLREYCLGALLVRSFYARTRRFLNHVRMFDSCRGHRAPRV